MNFKNDFQNWEKMGRWAIVVKGINVPNGLRRLSRSKIKVSAEDDVRQSN